MQKFVVCREQPLPYPFYLLDWFFFSLKAACCFHSSTSLLKQFLFCNENVVALYSADRPRPRPRQILSVPAVLVEIPCILLFASL